MVSAKGLVVKATGRRKGMMKRPVEVFDQIIFIALCGLIFYLPIGIAFVEIFTGIAVLCFLLKRIFLIVERNIFKPRISYSARWHNIYSVIRPIDTGLNVWLALFFWIHVMSAVFGIDPGRSWLALGPKFVERCLLFFAFVEVMNPRRLCIFLGTWFVSAFLVSCSGLTQYFIGKDFLRGNILSGSQVRASFNHPNNFGFYLTMVVPVLLTAGVYSFSRRYAVDASAVKLNLPSGKWGSHLRAGLFLTVLLCLINLGLTFSRGAWLGFAVAMLLWWVFQKRRRFIGILLLLCFLFIFIPKLWDVRNIIQPGFFRKAKDTAVFEVKRTEQESPDMNAAFAKHPSPSTEVLAGAEEPTDLTADLPRQEKGRISFMALHGREIFWRKAVEVIISRPLLGAGLNNYVKASKNFYQEQMWHFDYEAHNFYLQLAAELGIPGLLIFLGFLFGLYHQALNVLRTSGQGGMSAVLRGSMLGLSAYLVHDFFDTGFYTIQTNTLFWLLCGLTVFLSLNLRNDYVKKN